MRFLSQKQRSGFFPEKKNEIIKLGSKKFDVGSYDKVILLESVFFSTKN